VNRVLKTGAFLPAASVSMNVAGPSGFTMACGMCSSRDEWDQAPWRARERKPGVHVPDTDDIRWGGIGAALDAEIPEGERLGLRSARGIVVAMLLSAVFWALLAMWPR
jgi:hypothetical protein